MQFAAVCYLVRENEGRTEVCLSEKKRGYGKGLLHAYGGIIKPPETSSQCAGREAREESGVIITEASLKRIAVVTTFTWRGKPWRVQMFRCDSWTGTPQESDECGPPQWFPLDGLPYKRMYPDREYWMTRAFSGEVLHAQVYLSEDGKEVAYAHCGPLPRDL